MRSLFALLLLAGCPPPPRYAVVEVTTPAPLADAMVAARCGMSSVATRTNDVGRTRLTVHGQASADRCVLTVAKPGYTTVETTGVELCTSPTACPPVGIHVEAL